MSKQPVDFTSPRADKDHAAGGCGDCMALTKKLLNSEAERLEMTLQLAKQKIVTSGSSLENHHVKATKS